jgi:aspartyl/asparaginyl-tRNA synthetase
MQKFEDKRYAKKIDVILSGMETIGSAERSCNKDEMRETFRTISNGDYAKLLYSHFGKERVDAELEEFLKYDFIPRSGGGIGITRLISSLKKENLLK